MSETHTVRVCADTKPGDVLVTCSCGRARPAHRKHGWHAPVRVTNGVVTGEPVDDDDDGMGEDAVSEL